MNNVDLIIKYLSGEMNQDEVGFFEKDLASDPVLKEEFEEVSAAYRLISDQLQKRDEDAFRDKLRKVMEKPILKNRNRSYPHRPIWYFLLPLAGSLAILLAVFLVNRGNNQILSRFYEPNKDPVILAYNQETRGNVQPGISLYNGNHYQEAMEELSELMKLDQDNQLIVLFYLLSSMELDLQDVALEKVQALTINTSHQLGQSLCWYTTLALIKSNRMEEAASQLMTLSEQPGPYRRDVRRLQKMLLK